MKSINHRAGLVSVSFRAHAPREILCAMKTAGLSLIEWGSDVHAPCRDAAPVRTKSCCSRPPSS